MLKNKLNLIILSILLFSIFLFYSSNNENEFILSVTSVGDMVFPYDLNNINIFDELYDYFKSDINLGNLEGPITDSSKSTKNISSGKYFAFKFSPQITPLILKKFNFSGVLISNNHTFDYGEEGFKDTIKYLKEVNIEPIGLKDSYTQIKIKNKKIAIIGFYTNSRFNDLRDLTFSSSFIKKIKESNDFIIIFFHGGTEGANAKYVYNKTEYFGNENRGNIFAFAHTAIDSGADLVIGSGPHILRGFEIYKNKLIAYSLGNFIPAGGLSVKGELSMSCILESFYDLKTNSFIKAKIIPIDLSTKYPKIDNTNKVINFLRELTKQIYIDNYKKDPDIIIDNDGFIFYK
jgi:hypothetical protein